MNWLQQMASALYLAGGIAAILGLALPSPRLSRAALWTLVAAVVAQGFGFATLHNQAPVPSLTDLAHAISFTAWISVIALLFFMWRSRLEGLAAVVGPVAFVAVFVASLQVPTDFGAHSSSQGLPHAHVLLASAGLGLVGVSGLSGIFYLLEHRRLKRKQFDRHAIHLPSLEALNRVNEVALWVGFPLLTLGLITGAAWTYSMQGTLLSMSHHVVWTLVGWAIYVGLVVARLGFHQGARQAAATSVAGFCFLLFAVVGVELLS